MNTFDQRTRAQVPDRSLRDEIQPILAELEKAASEELHVMMPRIKRQLRDLYKLARDYEAEVSRLRWNIQALQDTPRNSQLASSNVIPLRRIK